MEKWKVQFCHFVWWITCKYLHCLSTLSLSRGLHQSFIDLDFSRFQASMNWTGGQLHRSAHQATLSRTQKQNFAKSRQVAIDRSFCQQSPFRAFPNLDKRELTASRDGRTGPVEVAEEKTQLVAKWLPTQFCAIILQRCRKTCPCLVLINP